MSFPKVVVNFGNGNLLPDVNAVDGIMGIVGTVATVSLQNVPLMVYNLADAEQKGITAIAEPVLHRHISEFYAEINGNQLLYVMGVPDSVTMAQMLDKKNATGAKQLLKFSANTIRVLGVYRTPPAGYNAGTDFLDADVIAAVNASKTFCTDQNSNNANFLRVLVEGRVVIANQNTPPSVTPTSLSNGYAGIVLGGSANDGSASVGCVLGRASAYAAHIKLGKVANGPLQINQAFIGDKDVTTMVNLETLHDMGFITFITHPTKAGLYFGKDFMCSTDDYRRLVYGRIVDKAAVIAIATYVNNLEEEVDVDANGNIMEIDRLHLADVITQQINNAMSEQISASPTVIIDGSNIINTGTVTIKLLIRPKGYLTDIEVQINLNAPNA
ncbi:MAG: hypothetical protein EKK39_14925 [Sphingobacteriales bacterium]|nr:MAG: hypothetical protein EKK39_14925 [Sphingobacteriales bacterium]